MTIGQLMSRAFGIVTDRGRDRAAQYVALRGLFIGDELDTLRKHINDEIGIVDEPDGWTAQVNVDYGPQELCPPVIEGELLGSGKWKAWLVLDDKAGTAYYEVNSQ